ncbi:MAG: transposase [Planctomycetaceae bacterium]|nr:transposase [Planctomycetaceae bacterium]
MFTSPNLTGDRYVHFITFSCFKRRRLLVTPKVNHILLGGLDRLLAQHSAKCVGFVFMPDLLHALIWLPQAEDLTAFVQEWKGRSSRHINAAMSSHIPNYLATISSDDPIWQTGYYSFEIETAAKLEEKLNYIHLNPVRAGLAEATTEWPWSSARWYESGKPVGIPIEWIQI